MKKTATPYAKKKEIFKGRFAPTPSGFLHLGNLFASLLAWLAAKSNGGDIVLRIEDLDAARCPRSNADALARDLSWLGLNWDEGAYCGADDDNFFQSKRSAVYEVYFSRLAELGLVYPCFCSRNDLHAASAPHLSDGRVVYPGYCRNLAEDEILRRSSARPPAWRLRVDDAEVAFIDGHYGPQHFQLARDNGDFVIRRSDGIFAYQLAVAVDDSLLGVTQVVRGWDLLSSTALQLYLLQLLQLRAPQEYLHIPLLVAKDGRRLAKRDGDTELSVLKRRWGDSPEPIVGRLAFLAGLIERPEPLKAEELLPLYDPEKIPRQNIVVPPDLF